MSSINTDHLKSLGSTTDYAFNGPHAHLLEAFASPFEQSASKAGKVHISVPEFTSLCPMTGQPDFATIIIDYMPDKLCVESKSLKLYMMSFRNAGEFHEACINRIGNDLVKLLRPLNMHIRGEFTPRGGIPIWPTFVYTAAADGNAQGNLALG